MHGIYYQQIEFPHRRKEINKKRKEKIKMADKRLVTIITLLIVIIASFVTSLVYVNISLEVTSETIASIPRSQLFIYSNPDKYRGPEYGGDYIYIGNTHMKNNAVLSTTYKLPHDWVACAYDKDTKTSRDLQFMLSSQEPKGFEGGMNQLYYDLDAGEEKDITFRVSPYRYYEKGEDIAKYDDLLLVPRTSSFHYAPDICASVSEAILGKAINIPITD